MRWKVGTGGEKEGNNSIRRKKHASIKTEEDEGLLQSVHWYLSTSYAPSPMLENDMLQKQKAWYLELQNTQCASIL